MAQQWRHLNLTEISLITTQFYRPAGPSGRVTHSTSARARKKNAIAPLILRERERERETARKREMGGGQRNRGKRNRDGTVEAYFSWLKTVGTSELERSRLSLSLSLSFLKYPAD